MDLPDGALDFLESPIRLSGDILLGEVTEWCSRLSRNGPLDFLKDAIFAFPATRFSASLPGGALEQGYRLSRESYSPVRRYNSG